MLASKATCSLNSNALLQLEILQSRNESAYAFFLQKIILDFFLAHYF